MSNVKLAIRVRPFTEKSKQWFLRLLRNHSSGLKNSFSVGLVHSWINGTFIERERKLFYFATSQNKDVHTSIVLPAQRELRSEKENIPVVGVIDNNTVTITNIKVSLSGAGDSRERTRRYFADYTFDSSCPVTHIAYASQKKVFDNIGRSVISSVLQGCSACVLAYGQSATGKTHTMMGTETQPGLVPRICKALFEEQSLEYTISFLEIYNERVHDLLCGEAPLPTCHSLPRRRGNARKDLRVREHPQRGTYVQNLRRVSVHDVEALLALVAEGVKRRRTAATKRNSTSSRSHALLEIATPHATLHLADLAGSEKASWEGCGGGRQKEGANINKSLVALSNVISALVSGGPARGRFVPYRDSSLTWLLKDCFTGGANTFIIATVSPSAACYGESASTLRWAARARQLPTPRAINCSSGVASRAALQAQFNQLIAELTSNHIRYNPETGKLTFDDLHWKLHRNASNSDELSKITKIGNIMNIGRPNNDANNSESTASSVASGSSDVINALDKNVNITNEIKKEVDNLFSPTLERTSSGDDLKVIAPLRHKRRQCRSQEVLTIDETAVKDATSSLINSKPSQSEIQLNDLNTSPKQKVPNVTILHENQRAEIVASVTERLYSKLKKKEEAAASKVESIVERKIVEPLSELKICSNARQRLMELSHKAIRNRRRIGIPAHTQTRRIVTRVKDQATEVQTDLHPYELNSRHVFKLNKDVSTETVSMTPRCKEISVGPTSSLSYKDRSTGTKTVIHKNSFAMTDSVVKVENSTQTQIVPPPRRKKRASNLSKHIGKDERRYHPEECAISPVISINISQTYPTDSESQSSDDNLETFVKPNKPTYVTPTPDLLTNHSTSDTPNIGEADEEANSVSVSMAEDDLATSAHSKFGIKIGEEFPDTEHIALPRVSNKSVTNVNAFEMKNMILGRSNNNYPYSIVLSPPKERDTKRLVKFKDIDVVQEDILATKSMHQNINVHGKHDCDSVVTASESDCVLFNDYDTYSDSTDSSKVDTGSFIWKKGTDNGSVGSFRKAYVPVYKSAKCKTFKENISGLGRTENFKKSSPNYIDLSENIDSIGSSDSRGTDGISEYKFRRRKSNANKTDCDNAEFHSIERKIYDSCNKLEETVKKYENYVANTKERTKHLAPEPTVRRPKEYLQHLVKLRREVVKAESDNTDSSLDVPHRI